MDVEHEEKHLEPFISDSKIPDELTTSYYLSIYLLKAMISILDCLMEIECIISEVMVFSAPLSLLGQQKEPFSLESQQK